MQTSWTVEDAEYCGAILLRNFVSPLSLHSNIPTVYALLAEFVKQTLEKLRFSLKGGGTTVGGGRILVPKGHIALRSNISHRRYIANSDRNLYRYKSPSQLTLTAPFRQGGLCKGKPKYASLVQTNVYAPSNCTKETKISNKNANTFVRLYKTRTNV